MFSFDVQFTNVVQTFRNPFLDKLMLVISLPGYGMYKYSLLPLVFIFLLLKKWTKEGIMLLFSALGAELLSIIVKNIVGRQRPSTALIDYIYQAEKSFSFPSGHVVYYMGFFGFIFYISMRKIEDIFIRRIICGVCLFFIILIGISRIYLGEHWFSDVAGGYVLGGIWLAISIKVYNIWLSHDESKN